MIRFIYGALKVNGISAENLLLGMGGALLQKVDRDTQKFAFKCSYAEVNGKPVDVQKHPVELDAHGHLVQSFKRSKAGKLKLIREDNTYQTVRQEAEPASEDHLLTVFENGELLNQNHFDAVRNRAAIR
jgi:nicotinamide phosphoribosyltransferase